MKKIRFYWNCLINGFLKKIYILILIFNIYRSIARSIFLWIYIVDSYAFKFCNFVNFCRNIGFHPSIGIAKAIAVVAYYSTASSFVEPKQLRSHRTNIHQTWYRRGTDKASLSQKFVDRIQFRSRPNRFARNLPCSTRVKYCSFNFYRNSENDYANLVYHVCDSIQCLKIPFFFTKWNEKI